MRFPTPHFDGFVRAVRRRVLVIRWAERIGLCEAFACAAALVLLPILLWRGEPTLTVSLVTLCLGLVAGMIWAAGVRVSALTAATEADRQLDLSDLLATAWAADADDAWGTTIRALAEAQCQTLSPASLILNKLGRRTWGGIGLAAALVLTLGLLSSNPADTSAASWAAAHPAQGVFPASPETRSANVIVSNPQALRARPGGDAPSDEASNRSTPENSTTPGDRSHTANPSSTGGAGTSSETSAASHGMGQTPADIARTNHLLDAGGHTSSNAGGQVAGGIGSASHDPSAQPGATGNTISGQSSAIHPSPPWESSQWPAAQRSVDDELRSGRVDPAYQDLVRDYFDRP